MGGAKALVFAKYPQAGQVKTRMAPPLTPEQASKLHLACLQTVFERLSSIRAFDISLWVTPDEQASRLCSLLGLSEAQGRGQGGGDLGARLKRAAASALGGEAGAVVLFGADSPTIPLAWLRRALRELEEHEAVLGPTEDGGYYLLGLRVHVPALFSGIAWGTSRVAEQTMQRAGAAGVDLVTLPTWYDVDRIEDLERARADLETMDGAEGPAAQRLRGLLLELLDRWR